MEELWRYRFMRGCELFAKDYALQDTRVCKGPAKILVVNAGVDWLFSHGKLNAMLSDTIGNFLREAHACEITTVCVTDVEKKEWQATLLAEHCSALQWADTVVFQTPVWWFSSPWQLQRWMHDLYTHLLLGATPPPDRNNPTPHTPHTACTGYTGYTHRTPHTGHTPHTGEPLCSPKPLRRKTYMLSTTWNGPRRCFEDPKWTPFRAMGVDFVFQSLHHANRFMGMKPLSSFHAFDVVKDLHPDQLVADVKSHLNKIFLQQ